MNLPLLGCNRRSATCKYANQNPDGTWTSQLNFGLTTFSGIHVRWRYSDGCDQPHSAYANYASVANNFIGG